MAVNQDIWGNEQYWYIDSGTETGDIAKDYNYYLANFTDTETTDIINTLLYKGCLTNKISINTDIDKSLGWCGLGSFSTFSNVEYYNNKTWNGDVSEDTNTNFGMINKDERSVTNFALMQVPSVSSSILPNWQSNWYYADSGNSIYATRIKWTPDAQELTDSASTNNFNISLSPYVQLPFKNAVLVPFLKVRTTVTSASSSEEAWVYMWDYLNTNNTVNYQTHPYIINIGVQAWGYFSTSYTQRTSRLDGTAFFTITDYINGNVNQPYDVESLSPTRQGQTIQLTAFRKAWGTGASATPGPPIFGLIGNNTSSISIPRRTTDTNFKRRGSIILPHPNGKFAYIQNPSTSLNNPDTLIYYIEYYNNGDDDNLQEWVRKQIACFGMFFTDDESTANNGELDSENMLLGILDSNNIGQGFYSNGESNRDQKQWTWSTTNDSEYNPSSGGGGDDPYGDTTTFIKAGSGINPGGKWYADSNLGVWNGLLAWCNNLPVDGDDRLNLTQFYGQNPIDCIIEAKYIFVNDYTFGKTMGTEGPITLGSYNNGGVNSHPFSTSHPVEFNCGYADIDRPWGDFRDYDPYTTISLILPFSESIDLPTDIFMGHRCNLTELIDPLTGDLIYYVFVDNILYTSLTGNCAMDLSINGLETATYAQTRFSLQTQATVAKFNAMASLIGGAAGASISANLINPVGAVLQGLGGIVNMASGKYQADRYETQMSRVAPPPAKIQKASSNVQWGSMPVPHIVVASPLMVDDYSDADYKTQTGFTTYKVGKVGDEKGYVVCSSINPSGLSCSKEETEMITNLLTHGIYIK